MTPQLFAAFVAFAFVTSVTPGPNNLMLMASGANFGFRRTIPHMLGIGIGFSVMVLLVGLGLLQMFQTYPAAYTGLKIVSVAYLLWLAWKIANAAAPGSGRARAKPLSFAQAAAFQWVNPKAWAMALTAVSAYVPGQTWQGFVLIAVVFGVINLPTVSVWTVLGQQIRRVLTNPARLRAFNWIMALLLLGSLWPVIFP